MASVDEGTYRTREWADECKRLRTPSGIPVSINGHSVQGVWGLNKSVQSPILERRHRYKFPNACPTSSLFRVWRLVNLEKRNFANLRGGPGKPPL